MKLLTSRRIASSKISFTAMNIQTVSTVQPAIRLQQLQKHFSATTNSKMSDTNKNFLLSNVFNVKGKVRVLPGLGKHIC